MYGKAGYGLEFGEQNRVVWRRDVIKDMKKSWKGGQQAKLRWPQGALESLISANMNG